MSSRSRRSSVCRINFGGSFSNVTLFSSRKILPFWKVFVWLRKSCKSGRTFRVETGSGLSLSKCFGLILCLHTKFFLQRRTLLLPVTVEAIELIKSWPKMINCELFSHFYFVTLPMPRSCAHLDLLGTIGLAFGPKSGFKHKCQVRACDFGFRLQF